MGRRTSLAGEHYGGIRVIDLNGEELKHFGEQEGLPPYDQGMCVQPIGNGNAIVAGSFGDKRRGWCAVLECEEKSKVQVFHQGTKLRLSSQTADDGIEDVFRPTMMVDYAKGEDTPRKILVARRGAVQQSLPWLVIDPETLNVTTAEITTRSTDEWQPAAGFLRTGEGAIIAGGRPGIRNVIIPNYSDSVVDQECAPYVFDCGDQIVVPGERWVRLDRTTLEQIPGELMGFGNSFAWYGYSAHYGIVGWSLGRDLASFNVPTESFERFPAARSAAQSPAPAKPTVKLECPATYQLPPDELERLIATSELAIREPPAPVPENGMSFIPKGKSILTSG